MKFFWELYNYSIVDKEIIFIVLYQLIEYGHEEKRESIQQKSEQIQKSSLEEILDKKITSLSKELEQEKDHEKQQEILKSINSALDAIQKIKDKQ